MVSRASSVVMIQAVQHRKCGNSVTSRWCIARCQALPIETLMGACRIEIVNILVEDPVELRFIKDQHVIQTLAPHTAQKMLTDRIRLRCANGRSHHVDAASHTGELGAIFAVIVADQKPVGWKNLIQGEIQPASR